MNLDIAISRLMLMLNTYYDKQVIVSMDEYDASIMESEINGFYEECINFFKKVFFSTFKTNDNTIFTLFMLAGYLTPNENVLNRLRIPNLKISDNLKNICVR